MTPNSPPSISLFIWADGLKGRRSIFADPRKDKPKLVHLVPLKTIAPAQVEALLDNAFGADRRSRTAYRLRDGVGEIEELSFAAEDEAGQLVGSIQCWPVVLEHADGMSPLALIGPVAVSPDVQRGGIGRQLMAASLAAAASHGHDALVMIGDPEYYERFFGFSALETQGWDLPGPFERRRLLARITRPGGVPAIGELKPNPAFAREAASD